MKNKHSRKNKKDTIMKIRRHLKYPDTPNWDNFYKQIQSTTNSANRLAYANYDPSLGEPPTEAQIELLQSYIPDMPTLTMIGSEKLHGENMAVCYSNKELWVQGRNRIRTLLGDQNGMAQFVESTKDIWITLFSQIKNTYEVNTDESTIVLDCEWAGDNIQKGNAACSGTDKGAYIFDYLRVINNDTSETKFKSTEGLNIPEGKSIYLMKSFGSYKLILDLNNPTKCDLDLKALALKIEEHSPIAEYFDKPDNVGEGVYLTCFHNEKLLRLKAKGTKHGGKPKTPRQPKIPLTDEQLIAIAKLANEVTPEWRLNQAITETNAIEIKHVGEVIKWMMQDILKEEQPVILESNIEFKKAQGAIVQIVKDYYFDSIKGY